MTSAIKGYSEWLHLRMILILHSFNSVGRVYLGTKTTTQEDFGELVFLPPNL